ncbi:MAG: hypothetical protein Ct9H300mP14_06250 [Gammaproteobacteria bacterium]|nr:MAG: hypothetical protein Ct9H300mP14_06250 [Gammaproteobacteria bacterium]
MLPILPDGPVEAAWIEEISGKGIDGSAALEELRRLPVLTHKP